MAHISLISAPARQPLRHVFRRFTQTSVPRYPRTDHRGEESESINGTGVGRSESSSDHHHDAARESRDSEPLTSELDSEKGRAGVGSVLTVPLAPFFGEGVEDNVGVGDAKGRLVVEDESGKRVVDEKKEDAA